MNFLSLKAISAINKRFSQKENHTGWHMATQESATCPAGVSMTSAQGQQLLTSSWHQRWLGQCWPGQCWRHQRPWWCQHLADPVLTSCWCQQDTWHSLVLPRVALCVFFSWKPFNNSRNCFKLQKFIINQPELQKLWNQFHNSSKIMIYALE